MARKCKCCSKDIVGGKCSYCGYINVEVLDDSGSEAEITRAEEYRTSLVKRITDFSINAYTYKWNENDSKLDSGRANIKICDGEKSYKTIAWSQKSFGQNIDDKQTERPATISYKFDGKKKDLNIELKTIRCDDFWKLGVMINQDLTVSFYLGTNNNHTISGPFDLELE